MKPRYHRAFLIQLLYMMAAIGASILISQNLGAGRRREAGQVGVGSLALIVAISVAVSAIAAAARRMALNEPVRFTLMTRANSSSGCGPVLPMTL